MLLQTEDKELFFALTDNRTRGLRFPDRCLGIGSAETVKADKRKPSHRTDQYDESAASVFVFIDTVFPDPVFLL